MFHSCLRRIPPAIFCFFCVVAASAIADEEEQPPTFRRHVVSAKSTFPAAAVLDLNQDKRPDILSGGWWWENPNWERHFVRDVKHIRGRFDDYSNLAIDLNADGHLDIISVNYRSKSILWTENPGAPGGRWKVHMIDTPGLSETGRLVDIDDDGQLDLLPNGVDFAAWYSWERKPSGNGGVDVVWRKHELPPEAAAHGLGHGDINQDGRTDLVTVNGWLQAPEDRRGGRWIWHPEFQLPPDGSIPMLVQDVDHDGDADIIWGRAHGIGLYWLEQNATPTGARQWTQHAIDTEISQAHSLLWADLDGNGQNELIAGKRFLAHEGRNLGEYDPAVIFRYVFDKQTHTWKRSVVSPPGPAGFDLDPKLADLDADGDLDLIAPSRNGLYWLENLRIAPTGAQPTQEDWSLPVAYDNHRELMAYREADGAELKPVKTPFDWGRRRAHILANMQRVMGRLPTPHRRMPLEIEILKEEDTPNYTRKTITFAAEQGDRVPAYLLIPKHLKTRAPAMLCLHQTTGIGKGEPAGLGGKPNLHYAHELAERGYVCLAPDYPSFGDYPYDFKADAYASGSMKAIWNNQRAVDLLISLPQVHPDRIGVIGHSLGGHNALFTAAFDRRLQAVVTSCGFTAFHHYYGGKLVGWTSDRYMPRIRDDYGNDPDRVPFDFHEVLAAIAPRAIFINAPLHDGNFDLAGVKEVMAAVSPVFKLHGAANKLHVEYPDSAHDFPPAQRQAAYLWLDELFGKK